LFFLIAPLFWLKASSPIHAGTRARTVIKSKFAIALLLLSMMLQQGMQCSLLRRDGRDPDD